MRKILFIGILLLGFELAVFGQENSGLPLMTLEEAVDLTIANNKQLKIQKNLVQISVNNVFKGNAGLMPTLSLAGNGVFGENQANIDIRTFQENPPLVSIEEDGVQSTTLSAGIRADYLLIGGFRGKYTYKLLENQQSISRYQQELVMNELILGVSNLYYDIAKLQSREELLIENVAISREQLRRIENQIEFGQVTGALSLAAQTDINQELNALDDVRLIKNNLIKELNFLMGIAPEEAYLVSVNFQDPPLIETSELKELVVRNNPELKITDGYISAAMNQLKIAESAKYPQLNAFADYGYFRQENDAQQLKKLETLGYTAGLSLNVLLFDGSRVKNKIKNSRIEIENSQTQASLTEDELIKEAVKEQSQLLILKAKLIRQENDLATFNDNFSRTQERFERGLASSLDLREAQRSLLNAKIGITDAKLDILKSVAKLRNLMGSDLEGL
ncbi:TolC family protein [Algoriphagus sp.]|uniref:TolC family protein n=1 Tax=Algoriphagus sp. TaxID=1872435 RepID=UPI00391D8A15